MTFAKQIVKGVRPKGLLFTQVIPCRMLPFQKSMYDKAIANQDDALDRKSEAVANFVFPGLSHDRKEIQGYYGRAGVNIVKNQLKSYYEVMNKLIAKQLSKAIGKEVEDNSDFLYISENGKTISGSILKLKYLKYYSVKFYSALKKLNRLFWGNKGARTAFVYSNLVKVGIELFQEILMQNGYLEYQENENDYTILPDTICYFCGNTYKEHQQEIMKKNAMLGRVTFKDDIKEDDSDSSDYEKPKGKLPEHTFHPAVFITVTGKSTEDNVDLIPEDKHQILNNIFNNDKNMQGKNIKLVLGSKVMNEGISLANVAEVHILDVYFNLGKVDQVMGRAIRHCMHYKMMNKKNPYPRVNVYKYAVTIDKGLSSEEELYKKAERKYLLIKKVERVMKEVAIDCPLNRHGNIFPEDLDKYNNCYKPTDPAKKNTEMCPAVCDYMKCEFKCEDALLNNKYYDPNRRMYKKMSKKELDVSTFTHSLARNEIENTKKNIKELYKVKYAYTLDVILSYVKDSYKDEKRDLFDNFFVFKALDELIPVTENDFNNFRDTVLDKYNRPGYLIYINKYYIYQPFDQPENVPMYYRTTYNKALVNKLSLYNYLKNKTEYKKFKGSNKTKKTSKEDTHYYDFDTTMEYYDSRNEFKYVGIIDKETYKKKNKHVDDIKDVFKIREKRNKILEKKRGTGIPSLKGAVCATSKNKAYLVNIVKKLNGKLNGKEIRSEICSIIQKKMLELEKYSTGKNKLTYVMIPKNHNNLPFPYNLEDRVKFIIEDIKDNIKFGIKINTKTIKLKKGYLSYVITIKNSNKLNDFNSYLKSINAELIKDVWNIKVE